MSRTLLRVLGSSALALLAVVMVVQSHRHESHATSVLLRQRLLDASSHTDVESQGGSTSDGSAPALATVANVAKVAQDAKVATIQSKGQHIARHDIAAVTQAERKLKERNNQLASERKVVQTEKTQLTVKKEIDSVEAEQRAVEHKLAQEDTRRERMNDVKRGMEAATRQRERRAVVKGPSGFKRVAHNQKVMRKRKHALPRKASPSSAKPSGKTATAKSESNSRDWRTQLGLIDP